MILDKYRIANPYPPKSLAVEEIRRLKPGLCCPDCASLEVEMKRYLATCHKCGFCETKQNAMRRFLYQYGLLTHQRPITSTEALELLGKQINTLYRQNTKNKF